MHEPIDENELRFELTVHEQGEELPAIDESVTGYFTGFVKIYKQEELPEELRNKPGIMTRLEIACDNMTVDEVAGILLFIQSEYPEAVSMVDQLTEIGHDGKGPVISFRDAEDEESGEDLDDE